VSYFTTGGEGVDYNDERRSVWVTIYIYMQASLGDLVLGSRPGRRINPGYQPAIEVQRLNVAARI
jgi:hypothetical protein